MSTTQRTNGIRFAAVSAFLLLIGIGGGVGSLFAGGAQDGRDGNSLALWHYESPNNAMSIAWDEAMRRFEEMHPEVTVAFERKGFEQIRQTAGMVLNSAQAPDVMEYNKGNATAGLLSQQGLLTNLTAVAEERGWDEIVTPSLQITSRYAEGIMGSGDWYGITNYGEYVMVYYNRDMFDQYGVGVPTTLAEFESVLQTFVDGGVTPITVAGAEYPAQQLFYILALSRADQDFINAFQLYQGEVDFRGDAFTFGAEKMVEWLDRGFIGADAVGMKAEDMGLAFIGGRSPIMVSGSWWYGRMMAEIDGFEWGTFLFPGNTFHPGSGGNLWVVPTNSSNPELAYDFIDITLQEEIQTILGNAGGIPINADLDEIQDPKVRELIAGFAEIVENDGLAFYPDWPAAGFYDVLVANVQRLMSGEAPPDEILESIAEAYADR